MVWIVGVEYQMIFFFEVWRGGEQGANAGCGCEFEGFVVGGCGCGFGDAFSAGDEQSN